MSLYKTLKLSREAQTAIQQATRQAQVLADRKLTQSELIIAALTVAAQFPDRLLNALATPAPPVTRQETHQ